MTLVADPTGLPTGREIRRWTRQRTRARSEAGLSELFSDVYIAVFGVVLTTSMVLSAASGLGHTIGSSPPTSSDGVSFAPAWTGILLALGGLAALTGLVSRMGPVALSPPESTWWLPLPADRRSLLRPVAARWPALAAVAGGALGLIAAVLIEADPGAGVVVAGGVLGAGAACALAAATGLSQSRPSAHAAVRVAADAVLGLTPLLGVALAVTATGAPTVSRSLLPLAAVAVVVAVAGVVVLDRRLPLVRDASLRGRGAAAELALGAVLSLDTRALGRALSERTERAVRRGSSSLRWLRSVPSHRTPDAALVTADALLLSRTPRHAVQVLAGASLPVLAFAVPQPLPAVTVLAVLVGGYMAALATAEGSRRAQVNPALDAMLPLSQTSVRRARLVVPVTVLVVWAVGVFAVVAWRYGDPASWLVLGVLAAPVWAGGAVRAAYRALPNFSGPLVQSPFGGLPPGLSSVVLKGPDVAAVGSVPVLIALVVGDVPQILLVAQAACALAVLAFVGRAPSRPPAATA